MRSSDEREYAKRRPEIDEITHILQDMDIIDSKSSALLTHVSIMLAAVFVLVSKATTRIEYVILTGELLAFSVVALLLLRCVDIMGPPYRQIPDDKKLAAEIYLHEVILRRAIYQRMVRSVMILTVLLIFVMVFKTVFTSTATGLAA